jgi:hypothetical protein
VVGASCIVPVYKGVRFGLKLGDTRLSFVMRMRINDGDD